MFGTRDEVVRSSRAMQACFSKIENSRLVVIAAINGLALGGGCELAAACDIRIAAEEAIIGVPEVKLGLIPGAGGTQRLARLLGKGRSKWMILSGDFFTARDALQMGLLEKVVPAAEVMPEARKLAASILANAPLAVEAGKRAVNEGVELPLEEGLILEAGLVGDLFLTEDLQEGAGAFVEKRFPVFRGK
jgi:enoyl-CoA hydratase